MDDLISRQAAVDSLNEERCPCESDYDKGYLSMLDKAIWIIQEWLPSAQPKIVRCGECKHMTPEGRCLEFADDNLRPSASDFCSYAERRIDDLG